MISKEDLAKLEFILREEQETIEKEIESLGENDMGSDTDHGEEEADETEEVATHQGMISPLKDRLKDVNLALDKIGANAYGVCEDCSEEISLHLLKVDPESRLCKNCKSKQKEEE
ncbi:MAG: TraR/DksA C4-type zinc finger protein [bacterium]|nr:TraR/DksA C4-type zinc finger protein [bacterium]